MQRLPSTFWGVGEVNSCSRYAMLTRIRKSILCFKPPATYQRSSIDIFHPHGSFATLLTTISTSCKNLRHLPCILPYILPCIPHCPQLSHACSHSACESQSIISKDITHPDSMLGVIDSMFGVTTVLGYRYFVRYSQDDGLPTKALVVLTF